MLSTRAVMSYLEVTDPLNYALICTTVSPLFMMNYGICEVETSNAVLSLG